MKVYWRKGHGTTAQLTSKYNKVLFKAPRHRNFTSVASCVCVCHHTHPISSDVLCDFLSTGPEFLAETWQWEKALEILHSGAIWGNGFSKDFLSTGWSFRCRLAQEKGNLRIKKNTRSSKPCSFASAANNCKNAKHANECQLISNNLNQWMLSELSNTDIHWSGGAKKVQGQDPAVRWLWPPDLQQGSFTVYTHIYHKYIYIYYVLIKSCWIRGVSSVSSLMPFHFPRQIHAMLRPVGIDLQCISQEAGGKQPWIRPGALSVPTI